MGSWGLGAAGVWARPGSGVGWWGVGGGGGSSRALYLLYLSIIKWLSGVRENGVAMKLKRSQNK